MTTDYKDYSLENFKNWLQDCLSTAEATPEEIYNTIKEVVTEENQIYKNGVEKTDKLLRLLDGKPSIFSNVNSDFNFNYHDTMNGVQFYHYSPSITDTQSDTVTFKSNVMKWTANLQQDEYGYFIHFPEDMCETLSIKDGDKVEFKNNYDGTITIRKVS